MPSMRRCRDLPVASRVAYPCALMRVRFVKSSQRHYGVVVERTCAPTVIAEPAPGYDDFLPHDLLHFVAEAEWRLDGAVFGQLAAGGDPGLFLPVDDELLGRCVRQRKLRKTKQHRGRSEGPRSDAARSEALAAVLDAAWRAHTSRAPLPEYWDVVLAQARAEPQQLERVLGSVGDLASRWHRLQIGRSLTLEWPRPERRRHHHDTAARPRRSRTLRRLGQP
jgi:hypothetical protein